MSRRRGALLLAAGALVVGVPVPARADAASCRALWRDAAEQSAAGPLDGVATGAALASRWNALAAGADYHARTATTDDCGALLLAQASAVAALVSVGARAAAYDVQVRVRGAELVGAVRIGGQDPAPAKLTAALGVLAAQTATAVSDLAPAYAEFGAADPADPAAVQQALDDLALLAETSDAYAAVTAAVTTLGPPAPAPAPRTSGGKGG